MISWGHALIPPPSLKGVGTGPAGDDHMPVPDSRAGTKQPWATLLSLAAPGMPVCLPASHPHEGKVEVTRTTSSPPQNRGHTLACGRMSAQRPPGNPDIQTVTAVGRPSPYPGL